MSLLHYQMTTNNAVNRNLTCVINNWNNSSYYLWTNKVIYNSCMNIELVLIWLNIKFTENWFYDSTTLTVIEYFPYLFALYKRFMRLLCVELEVTYLCWSEEKLNHLLKIEGDKLFKGLLTNKVFSNQILSRNCKMKFCLNRGLV